MRELLAVYPTFFSIAWKSFEHINLVTDSRRQSHYFYDFMRLDL